MAGQARGGEGEGPVWKTRTIARVLVSAPGRPSLILSALALWAKADRSASPRENPRARETRRSLPDPRAPTPRGLRAENKNRDSASRLASRARVFCVSSAPPPVDSPFQASLFHGSPLHRWRGSRRNPELPISPELCAIGRSPSDVRLARRDERGFDRRGRRISDAALRPPHPARICETR